MGGPWGFAASALSSAGGESVSFLSGLFVSSLVASMFRQLCDDDREVVDSWMGDGAVSIPLFSSGRDIVKRFLNYEIVHINKRKISRYTLLGQSLWLSNVCLNTDKEDI